MMYGGVFTVYFDSITKYYFQVVYSCTITTWFSIYAISLRHTFQLITVSLTLTFLQGIQSLTMSRRFMVSLMWKVSLLIYFLRSVLT